MHDSIYPDYFSDTKKYGGYTEDIRKRLIYARDNGCDVCILTGNNEPQQNREFLRVFSEVNKSLPSPFVNIEMQTTGSFITDDSLDFYKYSVGITTIALSISCLDDNEVNKDIIQTKDIFLNLLELCNLIKERNINLRLCLNLNDLILAHHTFDAESIIGECLNLHADQLIFRKIWTANNNSDQSKWVEENVTEKTSALLDDLKNYIRKNGIYLDELRYGLARYDLHGMSTVIDEDCMAKDIEKNALKYLILRPDGHLYTKWDSKASLVF